MCTAFHIKSKPVVVDDSLRIASTRFDSLRIASTRFDSLRLASYRFVECTVCLPPHMLSRNYMSEILGVARKQLEKKCIGGDGHVISVLAVTSIENNIITSSNSDIVITIRVDVSTLRPQVGMRLRGTVVMILVHGLFVEVDGMIKVLVHARDLVGYTFDGGSMSFLHSAASAIKRGSHIDIQLNGVQFVKGKFNCFGVLAALQ